MRLGIALEGGGVRCMAQVGVLLTLLDAGIRPFAVAGCGAGALVAAMTASGTLSENAAKDFAKSAYRFTRLRAASVDSRLRAHFGGHSMREMGPVALPSIDMETGVVQVLSSVLPIRPDPRPWSRQALITTAVRASMAAPGAMPPVSWRSRRLLGGGQLRNTLPELLLAMGAERLITVRVLAAGCGQAETRRAALCLCAQALIAPEPPPADLVITIGGYERGSGVLSRRDAAAFLKAGRMAGMRALPQVRRLLGEERGKILSFPVGGDF